MFEHKINKDLSLRLAHVTDSEEVYKLIDGSRVHLKKMAQMGRRDEGCERLPIL